MSQDPSQDSFHDEPNLPHMDETAHDKRTAHNVRGEVSIKFNVSRSRIMKPDTISPHDGSHIGPENNYNAKAGLQSIFSRAAHEAAWKDPVVRETYRKRLEENKAKQPAEAKVEDASDHVLPQDDAPPVAHDFHDNKQSEGFFSGIQRVIKRIGATLGIAKK